MPHGLYEAGRGGWMDGCQSMGGRVGMEMMRGGIKRGEACCASIATSGVVEVAILFSCRLSSSCCLIQFCDLFD